MTLYIDVTQGDRIIKGITDGTAVQHADRNLIEVWDEEGEQFYGVMPAGSTPEQITAAIKFYQAGHRDGVELGKHQKQTEIRTALGIRVA